MPEFVQQGKVRVVRREYHEAIKVCRLGLLKHPTCVEGRLVLGLALMALGRYDEVLTEMAAALQLNPAVPMAHLLKGEALHHRGEYKDARQALLQARALDPNNEKVDRLIARVDAHIASSAAESGFEGRRPTDTKQYPNPRANQNEGESIVEWDPPLEDTAMETLHTPRPSMVRGDESLIAPDDHEINTSPFIAPPISGQGGYTPEGAFGSSVEIPDEEPTAVDDGRLVPTPTGLVGKERAALARAAILTSETRPGETVSGDLDTGPTKSTVNDGPSGRRKANADLVDLPSPDALLPPDERSFDRVAQTPPRHAFQATAAVSVDPINSDAAPAPRDVRLMSDVSIEEVRIDPPVSGETTPIRDVIERDAGSSEQDDDDELIELSRVEILSESQPKAQFEASFSDVSTEQRLRTARPAEVDDDPTRVRFDPNELEDARETRLHFDQQTDADRPSAAGRLASDAASAYRTRELERGERAAHGLPDPRQDFGRAPSRNHGVEPRGADAAVRGGAALDRPSVDAARLAVPQHHQPSPPPGRIEQPFFEPSLLEQRTGALGQRTQPAGPDDIPERSLEYEGEALTRPHGPKRGRAPRFGHSASARPLTQGATSFFDLLLGERGGRRWIVLAAGAATVLLLAVGVGLLVRHFRVSDRVDSQRATAFLRIARGNLEDYNGAMQILRGILAKRAGDAQAKAAYARLAAAIPFEFGDPLPRSASEPNTQQLDAKARSVVRAYQALKGGDLRLAVQLVRELRSLHPDLPIALYLDGRIRLLRGQTADARTVLARAHALQPRDAVILRWLGEAAARLKQDQQAIESFRKALALNPRHIGTLLSLANMRLERRSHLVDVEQTLRRIVKGEERQVASRGERGWAWLLWAKLELIRGRFAEAKRMLRKARSNEPHNDVAFLDELSSALIDAFMLGAAEQVAIRSDQMMPGRPHPNYRKAQIYLRHGRPHDALEALRRSSSLQVSSLLKARIHLRLGQPEKARAEVEAALARGAGVAAQILKAEVLTSSGKASEAEALLTPLIKQHPGNAALLTALGRVYLQHGRPDQARERFEQALQLDAHNIDARLLLADALLAAGDYGSAHKQLVIVARTHTWHVVARCKLAELDVGRWDLTQARSDLEEVLKKAPMHQRARLDLIRVLTLLRDYAAAATELTKLRRTDRADLSLAAGRLALYRGDFKRAASQLAEAVDSRPKSAEAAKLLVRAYLYDNNVSAARQAAQKMTAQLSGPEAVATVGLVEWSDGKLSLATRILGRATKLLARRPKPPRIEAEIRVLAGRALSDSGKVDAALAQYDAAANACPLCPDPMHWKALALDEKGRGADAINLLSRALKIDPRNLEMIYDLAKVYENNEQSKLAIEMYERYLALSPPPELAKEAKEALSNLKR
ncbi:MAG: tetratricopeptide repeat protein [Deltaproteobacteria bacterium]|nr:tetratricopeptide repeat protein [Deltaproteobacteria bacterium]